MTELENMKRAKMYLDKLAQGIDPISNREIQVDSTLNNVRIARCFFYVSDLLGKLIAEESVAGKQSKLPFSITPEQLSRVPLSQEPLRITQITDRIHAAVNNPQMKKLNPTLLSTWLLEKGFLENSSDPDGKSRRIPTPHGFQIGLTTQIRQGRHGEYLAVLYNIHAQQFIIDNLPSILTEKF